MINKTTAQQIVDTVKDVCGHDINFINEKGLILASTNPSRIGTFHEGGQKVISAGTTLEVFESDTLLGTQKGVNIPVYHKGSLAAVIGISGDPQEVRIYAHLAERITLLLIREQELNAASRTLAEKKNHLLQLLLSNDRELTARLSEELKAFHINPRTPKRIFLMEFKASSSPESISSLETDIYHFLETLPQCLYSYQYPHTFTVLFDSSDLKEIKGRLSSFVSSRKENLKVGIGSAEGLPKLGSSLYTAKTALNTLRFSEHQIALFDELNLEILLTDIDEIHRKSFLKKSLQKLSPEDIQLLRTYFQENCSLLHTCQKLFLHKNTLQYKLNRIHRLCGLNPRNFHDSVILYLAVKLLDIPGEEPFDDTPLHDDTILP